MNLTLGIYTHTEMSDVAGAVEKLPTNLTIVAPKTAAQVSVAAKLQRRLAISVIIRGCQTEQPTRLAGVPRINGNAVTLNHNRHLRKSAQHIKKSRR